MAASRASRTMRKICRSRSEGGRPMSATQVMSAYTAFSSPCNLAQASIRSQSPRWMVADRSAEGS